MSQITNTKNPSLLTKSNQIANKVKALTQVVVGCIVDRRAVEREELEAKEKLRPLLRDLYFKYNTNADKSEKVQHTFDLGELQVNFVNTYFIKDATHTQQIAKLLGSTHPLNKCIEESAKIVLDVSDLEPEAANDLAREVTKLAVQEFGITPQVERKTTVTPEFHSLRHVYLTPDDNQQLEELMPTQVQLNLI